MRQVWPRGYKTFYMLSSTEQEIYHAHKCEKFQLVGIYNMREFDSKKFILLVKRPYN